MSVFTKETYLSAVTHHYSKSIPTTAYQTFLFVSDSIKLGRACSNNVYSLLRTKAEVIFMMVYQRVGRLSM